MNTHIITIKVTAPNRLSHDEVSSIVERLIWIGKEDAEATVKNGEGQLDEARDAMSLHFKFGEQS